MSTWGLPQRPEASGDHGTVVRSHEQLDMDAVNWIWN